MRTFSTLVFCLVVATFVAGQNPLKNLSSLPYSEPRPLQITSDLQTGSTNSAIGAWVPGTLGSVYGNHETVKSFHVTTSGSIWLEMKDNQLWSSRASVKEVLQKVLPVPVYEEPISLDWKIISEHQDPKGMEHIRVQQTFGGAPIYGQDMVLHIDRDELVSMNGYAWTGKMPVKIPAARPAEEALSKAKDYLVSKNVKFQQSPIMTGLSPQEDKAALTWYPLNGQLLPAWEVTMHPNYMDHWTLYIDASTMDVLKAYSKLCSFAPLQLFNLPQQTKCDDPHYMGIEKENGGQSASFLMDGATVIQDQDLLGQNRTVNAYQVGTNFFMIDASRSGMYQPNQSIMPDEPVGVIWTIDAQNTSPQLNDFSVVHVHNTNNNWKNLEVSAHYNAGQAYTYFLNTYSRNAINGSGGNIISIINVTDENDNDMDNAFWNGSAMFYGNGDVAFKELARGLDVAGHEMSHGVIGNTANLEYVGQSGALNESYADVFGAMIDRDDWKMGEDVVNASAFPSGALRDLSNPNNGGSQLGHPGWQPKHMNEYVNLPNTPENDNGGVHINSGIPNKAFHSLATAIGKEKAEQIYYKALTDYLVKSSQFIDMRIAAEKAATDLHGAGSTEAIAVANAFNGVGIGSGQGGNYEDDLDTNAGADFILATDFQQTDLYWIPPDNPTQFVKMDVPAPISKPSFTDDGSACVYIDDENNMIVIQFDWSQGLSYQAFYLEQNPQGIWQNIVVSKEGDKVAYTTSFLTNEINVFNLSTGIGETFVLTNPTTAGGLSTGDVQYPDAMEWDYSGEYLMYDALNLIESNFGDGIEYWDISFLHAWDNASNDPGSGQIGKLFTSIPENVSIGNPSFAKNSPYIITFDFVEAYYDNFGELQVDYRIKAANIEAGELNDIFINTTVGYPNYSPLDDKILFTYYSEDDGVLLGTIDIQGNNKIVPVEGTAAVLIGGAQKGIWFATGIRDLTSSEEIDGVANSLFVWPQPADDIVTVSAENFTEGADYVIWDMTGRLVREGYLPADGQLNISSLQPGSYILQAGMEGEKLFNARIVKQ